MSWLPFYLDKLNDIASPFYTRWGALLTKTLVEESRNLDLAQDLPLHLRESTPLADPRLEGGQAFLESLLAPVRSGLIFVRTDLERAGVELGSGCQDRGAEVRDRWRCWVRIRCRRSIGLAREAELWTHRHLATSPLDRTGRPVLGQPIE